LIKKRNPANVPAERYARAKTMWKISKDYDTNPERCEKMGVTPPLTDEQVEILLGTAYYHLFKESGWIDNPPY